MYFLSIGNQAEKWKSQDKEYSSKFVDRFQQKDKCSIFCSLPQLDFYYFFLLLFFFCTLTSDRKRRKGENIDEGLAGVFLVAKFCYQPLLGKSCLQGLEFSTAFAFNDNDFLLVQLG